MKRLVPCGFHPDYLGIPSSDAWHLRETPLFSFPNHEPICFYEGGGSSLHEMGFPAENLPDVLYVHVGDRQRTISEIQNRFMEGALRGLIRGGNAAKVTTVFRQLVTDAFEEPCLEVLMGFSGMVESMVEEVVRQPEFLQALRMTAAGGHRLSGHSVNLMMLIMSVTVRENLGEEDVVTWSLAGLLHDVGKQFLPGELASPSHQLSDEEFALYAQHPEKAHDILAPGGRSEELLMGVLHHHERGDGSGYPEGLRTVPDLSSLICMADSYDVLTSRRSHASGAMEPLDVLSLLKEETGQGKFPRPLFNKFANSLTE